MSSFVGSITVRGVLEEAIVELIKRFSDQFTKYWWDTDEETILTINDLIHWRRYEPTEPVECLPSNLWSKGEPLERAQERLQDWPRKSRNLTIGLKFTRIRRNTFYEDDWIVFYIYSLAALRQLRDSAFEIRACARHYRDEHVEDTAKSVLEELRRYAMTGRWQTLPL